MPTSPTVLTKASQNEGYLFGGPNNQDYNMLGSRVGPPQFGKLTYAVTGETAQPTLLSQDGQPNLTKFRNSNTVGGLPGCQCYGLRILIYI